MTTTNPTVTGTPSPVSRILVATDFSSPAESALEWGRRLRNSFGAKMILLHVIDVFGAAQLGVHMVGGDPLISILRPAAKRHIQEWQPREPDAEGVILEGSPRPLIVESAPVLQCQMIVMGTHGRSGIAHLLMGSVAEYVVRHSKVPVLTVRV